MLFFPRQSLIAYYYLVGLMMVSNHALAQWMEALFSCAKLLRKYYHPTVRLPSTMIANVLAKGIGA